MSKIEVNAIEPQCGTNLTVGASGDTITFPSGTTVVNNGSQSGFGRTGTVDWDTTPKTATFTAVSGEGYFCNTTGGAFTVNLPAGSAGAIVSLADYAATWQTNNLTVSPNGTEKIGSVNADVVLNTEGQSVTFVYVDSTQGWVNVQDSTSNERGNPNLVATGGTITTSGDYKIHTFTGPGTFTVSNASSTAANNIVSYLVVAGGGGSSGNGLGAGGAGGFREYKGPADSYTASPLNGNPGGTAVTITAQAYPITVGGGGTGGPCGSPQKASGGSNSVFSTITSTGGGGGASSGATRACTPVDGGSGGGGSRDSTVAGSGNTPPVSPPQGNPGGTGIFAGSNYGSGGGGGAGAVGTNGSGPAAGNGGAGVTSCITASPVARAGGGGGGTFCSPGGGTGGPGGGGSQGNAGTVNTGGGAGGSIGSHVSGFAGGSGIVIIRYKFQ